jgi:hypothetical protein
MDKLWPIQTLEYYSALKRNEVPGHEETRRKLKCILLSEGSQSEKATHGVILVTYVLEKTNLKK